MGSEQGRGPKSKPEPAGPLPRGRHDLAPEEVERHQRERIVVAVAKEMANRGYGDLTVGQIITRARLLELLSEGRRYPAAVALPQITEEALVGAISIVISRVLADDEVDYATLRSQLVEFVLAFYPGAGEVARVAGRGS